MYAKGMYWSLLTFSRLVADELIKRPLELLAPPLPSVQDTLASALKEGLSLEDDAPRSELSKMVVPQLLQMLQKAHKELMTLLNAIMLSNHRLIQPDRIPPDSSSGYPPQH